MEEMTNDCVIHGFNLVIGHSFIGHFLHSFHKDATLIYRSFLSSTFALLGQVGDTKCIFSASQTTVLREKLSLGEIMAPLRVHRTLHYFAFTGNSSVFNRQKMHFEVSESAKLELRIYLIKPRVLFQYSWRGEHIHSRRRARGFRGQQ